MNPAPAFEFPPKPLHSVYAPPPPVMPSQVALVQQQIQTLLSQKQAMALINPRDMANANQINVLNQVI